MRPLALGLAFGSCCASWLFAACTGDSFMVGSQSLGDGGGEAVDTNTGDQDGVGGSSPVAGSMSAGDGTPVAGSMPAGGSMPIGGTSVGGSMAIDGISQAGAAVATGGTNGDNVTPKDGTSNPPDTTSAGGQSGADSAGGAGADEIPPVTYPDCAAPILEGWSQPLGALSNEDALWDLEFGDPAVDIDNHRLVLSFDDVVTRTADYQGSYYVESDVTIPGSTVFTPYPYTDEVLLPSLRRSQNGNGIELGVNRYAREDTWSATGWGVASGLVIVGTTRVRLGAYMQVQSRAFAVKVSAAGRIYRSEWVTDFHWARTNLELMRYVGENNSGVYNDPSGTDLIYVNQLTGCQRLSDADVRKLFDL